MCRQLAWLGRPRTLHELLVAAPHALYEQSWAPRRQQYGTVNVDGFGAGWYAEARPEPVRYRRAQPIWTDASFASLAPTIAAPCVVASVRSATPGTAADESASAPFTHDRWLFAHNGRLHDWPAARAALWERAADVPDARAAVDSGLLFGLAVAAWQRGASLADGLAEAAGAVQPHGGGRMTLLAADGTSLAGLVCAGEPMHLREEADGIVIASEPHDDEAWRELKDGTVVDVTPDGAIERRL